MSELAAPHADLDEAVADMRYKPFRVKLLAVQAELRERAKPRRDLTQAQIAEMFSVAPRNLRTWVARYLKEGVEGLRARGGQGRKPAVSEDQMELAIKKGKESGGFQTTPEEQAPGCGACAATAEAKKEGKKGPARRKAPASASCRCGGRCEHPGRCKCSPGRACKCKCCRGLKLPPRGPRHAKGCPLAKILPRNALNAAILCSIVLGMFGKAYSASHMYAIMARHSLVRKSVSPIHVNHASVAAVRAWQRRLAVRLKKLRDAGYVIATFDECYAVRRKATGTMWVRCGEIAAQIFTGSGERMAIFGYYFENRAHRFQEYAHADSYAMIDSLRRIAAEHDRVAIIMDRMSAHRSKAVKKFLRKYRRDNPGKDIKLIFLPRGSPYLNPVEECWSLLKRAVAECYYYPRLDDFRWAVTDYLRTARFSMDIEAFLYRDPRKHLAAG